MTDRSASAVIVGADGSQAAANAVRWAIDEAISRDVPLRIVHVTGVEKQPADDVRREIEYAETSLRAATAVVDATGKPVKVETDILWGPVSTVLVDESSTATVLCVGSVGADGRTGEFLGSTAAALAENAHCPVAIICGSHHKPVGGVDWIVVIVNDHPDNDGVIDCTLNEARLRRAPVLAVGVGAEDLGEISYDELDRHMEKWKLRYPDVHIHPVATRGSIGQFLAGHADESVQLAVLGENDVDQIAYLVWPQSHTDAQHGERSVLIVPHPLRAAAFNAPSAATDQPPVQA
jgi:nucleotide-binding universal stress UspA family protein